MQTRILPRLCQGEAANLDFCGESPGASSVAEITRQRLPRGFYWESVDTSSNCSRLPTGGGQSGLYNQKPYVASHPDVGIALSLCKLTLSQNYRFVNCE
jgi:hypothetical protein